MSDLYQNIRSIRISKGMTQEELAEKMGYKSKSTIAKIESGVNDIPQSKIKAFAEALSVSISDLMDFAPQTLQFNQLTAHEQAVLSAYRAANPSIQAKIDNLLKIETRPVLQIEDEPRYKVRFAGRDGSIGEKFLTKEEIDALDALPDADDL